MQLPIELNTLYDFSTIGLEGGAKVVKWGSRDLSHDPVRNSAGQPACQPRVQPLLAPTTDEVVALFKFGEERRDFFGLMLQIAIHRDDNLARGDVEARLQCSRLAKVSAQTHDPDARIVVIDRAECV